MRTSIKLFLGVTVAILAVAAAVWLLRRDSQVSQNPSTNQTDTLRAAGDTMSVTTVDTATSSTSSKDQLIASAETPPRPLSAPTGKRHLPRKAPIVPTTEITSVSGRLDSWEDWNSSFSDTAVRTCSAIFDSARVDTMPGRRLGFAASGSQRDLVPISQVFCRIDSVRKLVKYTFPGQAVDFSIGVGLHASVSFSGELHPQEKFCKLTFLKLPEDPEDPAVRLARNQLMLVLTSPPGYAYILRVGIECRDNKNPEAATIYYTRPTVVEFRRIVRYEVLLPNAGDTVLLVTRNPRAVMEVARALPRSIVSAVLVPFDDSPPPGKFPAETPNLRLHYAAARSFRESYLILNDSEALVEGNELDPEFKHILQLRRKDAPTHQIAYPHITSYVHEPAQIERLRLAFQVFLRSKP